ncbi:hypothetical protein Jiend_44520 [Micromonospora endophytica]|uniref:hypothetical protein n=1 Tax=Micromonospora endophytica TaxID=515350 RepID=UPI000E6770AE|nr:hypothetical protein [Micromonospora endophytica]RIW47087.1 hypothetical protein D3H59_10890 [Micromonospora endophytica]BCJ61030.1 hypothetical protein Jiend_44520 [Micromonospora endophytica]
MTELERRYRRLLWAYPADYRRERGDEIVGTYLDLADPQRRRPSPAEAADLVRGGLRQRLRAAGANDLVPGVRLGALLALTTAAFLAAFWVFAERHLPPAEWGVPVFGPFVSVGIVAWCGWLLAALVAAVAPGRPTRAAITVALLVTAALPAISVVAGVPRPPLLVLVPQVALGVLALAIGDHLPAPARTLPVAAAVAGGGLSYAMGFDALWGAYRGGGEELLPPTGTVLLTVALLLAVGLGMRRDASGGWAVVALLTPVGLLNVHLLAGAVDGVVSAAPRPTYPTLVATAITVALLGPALLPAAVALRRRLGTPPAAPCPTCGARR